MRTLASLVAHAGFASGTPVAVARCIASGAIEESVTGTWPNDRPAVVSDRFYVASLAKQLTGAAVAVLVRDGQLDPDQSVKLWLSDLPHWVAEVTPRQLAHHIAGLPAAGVLEAQAPGDWTEDFALGALQFCPPVAPGLAHVYSNLGYILLARIVERISDEPFAAFVTSRLLEPLGVDGMGFVSEVTAYPQGALMGACLPLTHGDGGLWSTGGGFAAWLQRQNQDALGIAHIVESPGRLTDGTEIPYGWGVGLRAHRYHRLLIHGGEWTGAVAKSVRCPALGIVVVAMAAGGPFEALDRLVKAALDDAMPTGQR